MDTRESDGRGLWLRVSEWIRISAWLPPGLALAWLATLATLIHDTYIMLIVWAGTASLVLLIVLLVQRRPPRHRSPVAAEAVHTNLASVGAASSGAVFAGTATVESATPAGAHPAMGTGDKGGGAHGSAINPASRDGTASAHPLKGIDQTSADAAYLPVTGNLIVPELRVLTAEEVASVLRVDLDLVTRSITNGQLPGNRIGDHWRIDQGALVRWLQGSYEVPYRNDPGR
jgi:excisionase family DNA binding protein